MDEGPVGRSHGERDFLVARLTDDFVAAQGCDFLQVGDPGANRDRVMRQGWLQVFDLVGPHDPAGAEFPISIGRPALRCRVSHGGRLHPLQIGQVVHMIDDGVELVIGHHVRKMKDSGHQVRRVTGREDEQRPHYGRFAVG